MTLVPASFCDSVIKLEYIFVFSDKIVKIALKLRYKAK